MRGIDNRPLVYARKHRSRFLKELKEFIRFPSISAQPKHASDIKACANWLAEHLRGIGMHASQIFPTGGHPLVYAEWLGAPEKPLLLIYGHYDVQPPDPLKEWTSPPFDPIQRGQDLFGRGACDDKGQLFTHIKALEACLRTSGRLPVNVRCIFEGEEEIGSPHLPDFLRENRPALSAQSAAMSDTRMLGINQPAITYALRGSLSMEMEVQGPRSDLHSGNFGGAVTNPIQVLSEILAGLHDARGRVCIPGFYDSVRMPSKAEKEYMARYGPSNEEVLCDAGLEAEWGEAGFSAYERVTVRPALTFNGIQGGYTGPGGKSVIPSKASAKVNFRLVADQDPVRVEAMFRRHIEEHTPTGAWVEVRKFSSALPAEMDLKHPAFRAASWAYRQAFGSTPVYLRSGGTIPIVRTFQDLLGISTVLMGFALPDDRIHAPNEKFHLPNFYRGIETCILFYQRLVRNSA
jgi:acetylornithine deacetylase/succinyl-diaminopimelate desuccinylase-like protein